LNAVGEMSERFDIDIFAYVLMDNHYHLLVRTRRANLKKAMHWFGTTYTQRFNRRHFRSGHLFQGRYKSIIIQNDAYLLSNTLCMRKGFAEPKKKSGICCSMVSGKPAN
jgi:REP element-mobilizing transposase RayT